MPIKSSSKKLNFVKKKHEIDWFIAVFVIKSFYWNETKQTSYFRKPVRFKCSKSAPNTTSLRQYDLKITLIIPRGFQNLKILPDQLAILNLQFAVIGSRFSINDLQLSWQKELKSLLGTKLSFSASQLTLN